MTFEQLAIFVATAEREHLTQAAKALRLTPSAVSASIKALETFYRLKLFDRVGRGIQLTREGRVLLKEAKETLARVKATEAVLAELGNLKTGSLDVHASQTIANYWLPSRLLGFSAEYPGIKVNLAIGNTATVAAAVVSGDAELGFIEGELDEPLLAASTIASDKLVVVVSADETIEHGHDLGKLKWIMRERGSGTRSVLEQALKDLDIDPQSLDVRIVLPSNEALLSAVRQGGCVTALSQTIVSPFVVNGQLRVLDFDLPPRRFTLLRHKERHRSAPAGKFEAYCHVHLQDQGALTGGV
ncbi:LysR family transcriptional regulator [Metarhizobium album]|uniref:LysR family transcriptional regulator n=1 Tax=Metarhizobium album TaxID=2182425 RepID=A0A2U2DN00_9HYPH|nr:LysR substrate-binding domain-containing protein [Rhizobium album]PWE54650.1 LysR family transcriptional regulator [Rhizobium album]